MLISRPLLGLFAGALLLAAAQTTSPAHRDKVVAAHLAKAGFRAETDGQIVQAFLLFQEACNRDPRNARFQEERSTLEPRAKLLMDANVQSGNIAADVQAAEQEAAAARQNDRLGDQLAALTLTPEAEKDLEKLLPLPRVTAGSQLHSFDLQADDRGLLTQIAKAYGVDLVFDPDFETEGRVHFVLQNADFHAAMDAAAAATHTFLFPVRSNLLFAAHDSELKRNEFEPEMVVTVPLPNALDPKDIVEAANAVRGALALRGSIAWNSGSRSVVIRDHVSKARAAQAMLEALLLPRGQVSFDVQLMTVDSDTLYTYGISPQDTFRIAALGLLSRLHNVTIPSLLNGTTFQAFGGGASLLGIGLANAELFANYNQSNSHILYDAKVIVSDGQSASLHVGDKYPIPNALYSGYNQGGNNSSAAYNPIGQVTQEDLGLSLKVSPRIHGDGSISLELESEFRSLGSTTIDSVPTINQRGFKGSVTVQEGQWALLAGMQEEDTSLSRAGVAGLGDIPGLGNLFAKTTRDHRKSDTLVVLKPTITRLPMTAEISPQYLLGPQRGERVLF